MTRRTLWYLIEFITILWLSAVACVVIAATATALITVTILPPISDGSGLTLSKMQLDMLGKTSEELTISNHSSTWREVRVDLQPQAGSAKVCNLRYSPMSSAIPPGGVQVIRLIARNDSHKPCQTDHHLIITDPQSPTVPLFEVPVRTAGQYREQG